LRDSVGEDEIKDRRRYTLKWFKDYIREEYLRLTSLPHEEESTLTQEKNK